MKAIAEKAVKNELIEKMRAVCAEVGDCPIAPARDPSQLDCLQCAFTDLDLIIEELSQLRAFKISLTMYGTTVTKLEATRDPTLIRVLKLQRGKSL